MPGEKSLQHKLDRVRPPRVQITYDVETNGSEVKKELPFVLGVMADLAGHPDPDKEIQPVKDRAFVEINRDTFGNIMKAMGPRLAIRVPNTIQNDGSKIGLELNFETIEDFEPEQIVAKVEPLRKLLEARRKLADLKTKMVSNDKLEAVLREVIVATEAIKKQGAASSPAPAADEPEADQ